MITPKDDDRPICQPCPIERIEDTEPDGKNIEAEALIRTVKEQMQKITSMGKAILPDIMVVAENIEEPGRLADLLGSNLGFKAEESQAILEIAAQVIGRRADDAVWGIYHIADGGEADWHSFAKSALSLSERVAADHPLVAVSSNELPLRAPRPASSGS